MENESWNVSSKEPQMINKTLPVTLDINFYRHKFKNV